MKHHFYASVHGSNYKTPASRGSKIDGVIETFTNGWNNGVRVIGRHMETTEQDYFEVYQTHGSNTDDPRSQLIATFWEDGDIEWEDLPPTIEPDTQMSTEVALRNLMEAINSTWQSQVIARMPQAEMDRMHKAMHDASNSLRVMVTEREDRVLHSR